MVEDNTMSGMTSELALVSRVRQKFEALEGTCMSRYSSREQHVIATLSYCLSTLEQLHAWAVFAIFPLDEQNSEKYIDFVEQRFQCVVGPLRIFHQVVQSEEHRSNLSSSQHKGYLQSVIAANGTTCSARDHRASPHGNSGASPRESRVCSQDAVRTSAEGAPPGGSLRDRVKFLSQQYVDEGKEVSDIVTARLQKCRKDIRTIYRWGQASLLDLHEVMDDSLADELYFMVRGKMARVLSTISVFEEAAEAVEKTLLNYFPKDSTDKDDKKSSANRNLSDFPQDLPVKDTSQSMDVSEMRLALDRLEDSGCGLSLANGSPNVDQACLVDSNDSTPGSTTPEPPTSPRPKGLVNHPKIMKDRLQSYALPSKFPHMRMAPLNGSW